MAFSFFKQTKKKRKPKKKLNMALRLRLPKPPAVKSIPNKKGQGFRMFEMQQT